MYPYGLVGNCQTSALISENGSIDWLCLPRPDSPPVFGKLLDPEGGCFSVVPSQKFKTEQNYLQNTNILMTRFHCEDGSEFTITDFCPRFEQHGRTFRPNSLFRIVEPIRGNPKIKVICNPINGWEKESVKPIHGNSHLKFEIRGDYLRLVTNMSLTYLSEEREFVLSESICFGMTWGFSIEDDLRHVSLEFLNKTQNYWQTWVKHCSIPSQFQNETIRSALILKLHCYEDTGAILAALTTSLPEEVGQERNWDYRYCWLRDAAFVLSAFHNLGHFEEMEGFLKFLLDIAYKQEHSRGQLRPVYRLDQSVPLPEYQHPNWFGFEGASPVRSNNQAAEHIQNDVYGEMILTLAPMFLDERFRQLLSKGHEELLENLVTFAIKNISQPDAGLWEIRNGWQEHSFSNLMSWAGIERIIRIKENGFLNNLDLSLLKSAKIHAEKSIYSAQKDLSLRNGPKDDSYDAGLLYLPILRFPDAELCRKTVLEIAKHLKFGNSDRPAYFYRYLRKDDFGTPQSAFLVCSFWMVQALAKIGEIKRANDVMTEALQAANSLGLFSEHFIPGIKKQRGNFPQAYSHVGLINAAFAVSPPWSEVL